MSVSPLPERSQISQISQITAAPGAIHTDARPPIEMEPAPHPGAAVVPPYALVRPTVWPRSVVAPIVWEDPLAVLGYPVDDPYLRFWIAVIGPGAAADLLRLATAARRGRSLLRPVHLAVLVHEGLVRAVGTRVEVRTTIPPLDVDQVRRLAPHLRRAHGSLRLAGHRHPVTR